MDEKKARDILGVAIQEDGSLHASGHPTLAYTDWSPLWSSVCLDGSFTIDELEALIFWMKFRGRSFQ